MPASKKPLNTSLISASNVSTVCLGVIVHHCRGARLQHLECGVKGHQIVVVGTTTPASQNPSLQGIVAGAHLKSAYSPAVVMRVYQTGNYQVFRSTQIVVCFIARAEGLVGTHIYD